MDYDLVIIGAGPAGYVAAIRAGQTGLKTALIEKEHLGGMCLNWGCIPTKAMLESAKLMQRVKAADQFGVEGVDAGAVRLNWRLARDRAIRLVRRMTTSVETLLRKNDVAILAGEAILASPTSVRLEGRLITAKNIFIATGSVPEKKEFPVPAGMVLEIRELMALGTLPGRITIAGAGPNALELAQLLRLAEVEVTLVVPGDKILPNCDPYLSQYALSRLRKDRIRVLLETEVTGATAGGILAGAEEIPCDRLLNCSRRRAVLPGSEIELEQRHGFLLTDDSLRTNYPTVFAIGDVNGRSLMAHAASAQGLNAVNTVQGLKWQMDLSRFPINIYSFPEIAQAGLTEPEIMSRGIDCKISEYPLSANGKALMEGYFEGFVRLLSEAKYGQVLGVQIVAPHATDMISEAMTLMQMEGTVFDLARIVHAHPTVSEIFLEAGFAAVDHTISY